jgi:hypothetical protein
MHTGPTGCDRPSSGQRPRHPGSTLRAG